MQLTVNCNPTTMLIVTEITNSFCSFSAMFDAESDSSGVMSGLDLENSTSAPTAVQCKTPQQVHKISEQHNGTTM